MIQVTGGSVVGTDHVKIGKPGWTNNHDAYTWRFLSQKEGLVAVVCDGCGSGKHSEVGAQLGAHIVAQAVADEVQKIIGRGSLSDVPWTRIKQLVLAQITTVARAMGGSLSEIVQEYFLFTVVGTIVTPDESCVFYLGDGMYILNGEMNELGPFPNNSPPYLMYNLMGSSVTDTNPDLLDFQVTGNVPTSDLRSLIIGTDGVMDFIAVAEKNLPGKAEPVGPVEQFLEDRFFRNPDTIRRRLALTNRETIDGNRMKSGLLKDDTTLVVIRQRVESARELQKKEDA